MTLTELKEGGQLWYMPAQGQSTPEQDEDQIQCSSRAQT